MCWRAARCLSSVIPIQTSFGASRHRGLEFDELYAELANIGTLSNWLITESKLTYGISRLNTSLYV